MQHCTTIVAVPVNWAPGIQQSSVQWVGPGTRKGLEGITRCLCCKMLQYIRALKSLSGPGTFGNFPHGNQYLATTATET